MPRKQPQPTTKELTLESIEKLNHYQALGLSEAASSEEIEQALHVDRWPWHLVDEGAREFATRKRAQAYGVINDPKSRAAYDRELGYTKGLLAARIGEDTSVWGQAWLIMFGLISFLMVMGGPEHPARAIGGAFAPDFREVFVRKQPDCPPFLSCPSRYEREFQSSSDFWESVLNGWLPWIVPPVITIGIGLGLRPVVSRIAGYAVASVRLAGHKDGTTRLAMLLLIAAVPLVALALYWLLPPGGIPPPNG